MARYMLHERIIINQNNRTFVQIRGPSLNPQDNKKTQQRRNARNTDDIGAVRTSVADNVNVPVNRRFQEDGNLATIKE